MLVFGQAKALSPLDSPLESVNLCCTGTQGGRSEVAGLSRETLPALNRVGNGGNEKKKGEGKGEQVKAPLASPLESVNMFCTGTQGSSSVAADLIKYI